MKKTYRGHVYVACSISMYDYLDYETICTTIAKCTGKPVLPAKGLYGSAYSWKTKWPKICGHIASLVYFADTEGFIGRGTWVEIQDTLALGKPVIFYDPALGFLEHTPDFLQVYGKGKDWKKYAQVRVPYTRPGDTALQ